MDKENIAPVDAAGNGGSVFSGGKKKSHPPLISKQIQKPPSSLQLCIQLTEPDSSPGRSKPLDPLPSSFNIWDFSDSEAAPASSWSTLPNQSLLCRPLPLDVGRCTCVITREFIDGISVYALYTNEGHGRQDRKLAVARHGRRSRRSEFTIAKNTRGILHSSDESFLGTITANLMGSKYQIWDQGSNLDSLKSQSCRLLGVVMFVPSIRTLTGSFRRMRVWIPKQQSMHLKIQHIHDLPRNWEERKKGADQLVSRPPYYNNITKRQELDFKERGRAAFRIQTSVKNFQLTMEENGKQTILQLGRITKSQYVMDYRYPLTAYQAFCICLSSIDSKLCYSI
ncbi:Tubby-like protein 4 [Apostasia shenzhenica]|uniref:Tubby-like protein 4 n=1 Tax=Apostasia shenzhenica TaxID=1088818 RepID=A0A2I0BGY0_9ASPA|nr:Tubby-like protein 4 [Apostasia shenzhenica]